MNAPFQHSSIVSSKEFIGRKRELAQFVHTLVDERKSVALYGPIKSGKDTFVRQGFRELKANKFNFVVCEVDLSNIKTVDGFIELYREKLIELYNQAMSNALVKFDLNISSADLHSLFTLPSIISNDSNKIVIVYFKEFQNLLTIDDLQIDYASLAKLFKEQHGVRYIFTGSVVNEMKQFFEDDKYFYYLANIISMPSLSRPNCIEFVTLKMINAGRIIEKEEVERIVDVASCNIWYIKRICSICCSFLVGYINHDVVEDAIKCLLSELEPQYRAIIRDLTPNQMNFIRAIVDGVPRFSSTEVLEKYKLASSANVFRLKEAVRKKDIVTFDRNDIATFNDSMFKYWLEKVYFKI